jgi:16S rRNA (guanine527-N7)-methyltransferase
VSAVDPADNGGAEVQALARLGDRYGLSQPAIDALATLFRLLSGDPHAPTSVSDPRRVLDDHLADSLSALELPVIRAAATVADIGSGAGLPGLPLAAALPAARIWLVESNARKCEFIGRAAAAAGLGNASVVHERAESWVAGRGRHDVVTARALARLDVVTEYAAPLLRRGGSLVAWRGRRDPVDEAAGRLAAGRLGLELVGVVPVTPYPAAEHRHLHVLRKVADTPAGFPRRPGVARKRPLGVQSSAQSESVAPSDRDRR